MNELMEKVKGYWEARPCGTEDDRLAHLTPETKEWFQRIEEIRYKQEPMIFAAAQFTRHHGKKVLEIGVGAGSDHLQWARAGAELYGVDLTEAGIATTKKRLALFGQTSQLQVANAENLPFTENSFDLIYSWGVIHHSENPRKIIEEALRVLRPGGEIITMFYSKHSLRTWKYWIRYALLKGKLHWGIREVMWHHMESEGTRCYTESELEDLFSGFSNIQVCKYLTPYDLTWFPTWMHRWFPETLGFFSIVSAKKIKPVFL